MNCIIIYNQYSHYRKDLFDSLVSDENVNFQLFYGLNSSDFIKQFGLSQLKNIYFKEHLIWQRGAVSIFLKSKPNSKFILTGEVTILSNWLICLFAKFSSKKVFLHSHGFTFRENHFLRLVRFSFYKLSSGMLLYDSFQLRYIRKYYGIKSISINNSVFYDDLKELRNQIIWNNKSSEILYIGRIIAGKNLEWLIEAISNTRYTLKFIGPGSDVYFNELKLLSARHKVSLVILSELYNNRALLEHTNNSICMVLPGNCGLSGLHSIQLGLPVVTHSYRQLQTPEFNYIIEGINGYLYKYNERESFLKCIENCERIKSQSCNLNDFYWNYIEENFSINSQISKISKFIQ